MATAEIQQGRIQWLNEKDVRNGDYVFYWMQSYERAEYNHALEYALQQANELGQRLLIVFGLKDDQSSPRKENPLGVGVRQGH